MKIKTFIGIDPGGTGAVAVIFPDGTYQIWDNDPHPNVQADRWRDVMARLLEREDDSWPARAAIEDVHSMPGQGVSSTFKFGYAVGGLAHLLAWSAIPTIKVSPQKWKKAICGVHKGMDPKQVSLDMARGLFPDAELHLKKHNGRADALLIAEWLRRQER